MRTKIFEACIILIVAVAFTGCLPERKPKIGISVGEPIINVSGMWVGEECYLSIVQKGEKLEGISKTRYTHTTRQFRGRIDGNHVVLTSLSGNITYDLIVQRKKMRGTYSDSVVVSRPVLFKR